MILGLKKVFIIAAVIFGALMVGMLTFAFSEYANADTENALDSGSLSFTISGKVVDDLTGQPIKDIYISPWLNTEAGAILTDDVRTDDSGDFTISVSNVAGGVMGSIWIYEGNATGAATHEKYDTYKFAINEPISANTDIGTVALHPLRTGYKGKIVDENGIGIENLNIEFLNPLSTISPYATVCVVTDANGDFVIDPSNLKQGEWYKEPGLAVGVEYQVVVSNKVGAAPDAGYIAAEPSSVSVFSRDFDIVFNEDGTNSLSGDNKIEISMTKCVHVKMYDYNQIPSHCAMWKHSVSINGESDPNGIGWLGDSYLELPIGSTFDILADNTLKVTHTFNGDTYEEFYTPYLYILDNWEEVGVDETKVPEKWTMWINVAKPNSENYTRTCDPGDHVVLDNKFSNVSINSEFMDKENSSDKPEGSPDELPKSVDTNLSKDKDIVNADVNMSSNNNVDQVLTENHETTSFGIPSTGDTGTALCVLFGILFASALIYQIKNQFN